MATPASKPNAQKKDAPKKEKKPKAEVKKPKKEKIAVAEEKESSPQRGHAIVKSVLSGDALVLMGGSGVDGRIAPEKTVFLQGISAPRFARSRNTEDKDEPWAWHSREFLRKKVIGQKVSFVVVSRTGPKKDEKEKDADKEEKQSDKPKGGAAADKKGGKKAEHKEEKKERQPRDYCIVKLDELDLSTWMVSSGWAKAKAPPMKDGKVGALSTERQALRDFEDKARAGRLGMWSSPDNVHMIRTMEWNPDARAIFQKYKGVPLPAIVDYVRDGSTLRCELLGLDEYDLNHTVITLHLAGIQCPNTPIPNADSKEKQTAKPFAEEAKQFTAARLLHRDVHVVIQGVDKFNNFFGSVNFSKGNITLKLLEHGLAKVLSWSAAITPDAARIKEAERQAKEARLKIWADYTPEDEKEVQREISGKVVQVVSGDTLVIRTDEDADEKTFQLASIRVPRMPGPRGDIGEPFGMEAREFVRKRLIGHPVKVLIEYYKQRDGRDGKQDRAYVSINDGKGNLSLALLVNGLASVSRHRMEEDRSMYYEAYQKAEEQAIIEKKGMYGNIHHTARPINDLTQNRSAAAAVGGDSGGRERKSKAGAGGLQLKLKELSNDKHRAIVEHVFSGSRFKLYLPEKNFMLFFALAGIKVPRKQDDALGAIGKEATDIARTLILHHEVFVEFEAVDQGSNFLGSLYVRNENLSVQLLAQGYARTVFTASKSKNAEILLAAENQAKQQKLRLWQFEEDDKEDEEFKSETVAIKVTELINGHTFWFQNASDPAFENVEARMKEFDGDKATPIKEFKKDLICAGVFQQDNAWHRVRIVGRTKNEGEQRVFFIDYGNTDFMPSASLRQLPDDLATIPGAARQGVLIGCFTPADNKKPNGRAQKALQRLTELIYQHPVTAKIEAKTGSRNAAQYFVNVYTEAGENNEPPAIYVNQELLETGFVKLADSKRAPFAVEAQITELAQFADHAKAEGLGIWEQGNPDDDEEEESTDKRANGRQKGGKKK